MNDMTAAIAPKSDQLNADDLISGPRTIRITSVSINPSAEQKIAVSFEGDNGKPWKPCKTTARQMVAAWGADAKEYAGRSLTLYRDPSVKWGGLEVGGIRISHMSHIERDMVMAMTVTKGKKAPLTVKPLKADVAPLKVVIPPSDDTPFDFDAFADEVDRNIAAGTEGLAEWWETMKETRIQAGSVDRARAIALAGRVKAALEGEI